MVVTNSFFNAEEVTKKALALIPDYLCPPQKGVLRDFAREMVRYRMLIRAALPLNDEETKKFFDLQDAAEETNSYYMEKIRDIILELTTSPSEKPKISKR